MVKVTNTTSKVLSRRHPSGIILHWSPGETKDIESERLLKEVSNQSCWKIGESVGKKAVGGGIKTGVRPPKRRGRPPKSESKSKKEEVKSKKKLKKPNGLKKAKKEKAD